MEWWGDSGGDRLSGIGIRGKLAGIRAQGIVPVLEENARVLARQVLRCPFRSGHLILSQLGFSSHVSAASISRELCDGDRTLPMKGLMCRIRP